MSICPKVRAWIFHNVWEVQIQCTQTEINKFYFETLDHYNSIGLRG